MKYLFTICILLLTTVSIVAQKKLTTLDKTQFNGTWVFDVKASKTVFSAINSYTKNQYDGYDLTINFVEPELKIIEPQTENGTTSYNTLLFYTDGRGEKNKQVIYNDNAEIDSVTNWKDGVLIRKYKKNVYDSKKLVGEIKHIEKYTLSPEGTVLTIIDELRTDVKNLSPFENPAANDPIVFRRVYKKKQ